MVNNAAHFEELGSERISAPVLLPVVKTRIDGFVYFISGDFDLVKIGWAQDPIKRLCALQTGSPLPLFLVAVEAGPATLEKEYHERYKASWSHGEWFRKSPTLIAHYNEAAETPISDKFIQRARKLRYAGGALCGQVASGSIGTGRPLRKIAA
jgi:hypothetical protein